MSLAGVDEALRWKHLDSASVFSPLLTFGSVEWASFKFPSCTLSLSRSLGCISLISAEFIFNCPFVTSCWTCEMMIIDYWSETSRTRESPWWLLFRWAHCSFPTTVDPHPAHSIIDDGIDLCSWRSNRIVLWWPLTSPVHLPSPLSMFIW